MWFGVCVVILTPLEVIGKGKEGQAGRTMQVRLKVLITSSMPTSFA